MPRRGLGHQESMRFIPRACPPSTHKFPSENMLTGFHPRRCRALYPLTINKFVKFTVAGGTLG